MLAGRCPASQPIGNWLLNQNDLPESEEEEEEKEMAEEEEKDD